MVYAGCCVSLSVCLSFHLSVNHTRDLCQNGWTDWVSLCNESYPRVTLHCCVGGLIHTINAIISVTLPQNVDTVFRYFQPVELLQFVADANCRLYFADNTDDKYNDFTEYYYQPSYKVKKFFRWCEGRAVSLQRLSLLLSFSDNWQLTSDWHLRCPRVSCCLVTSDSLSSQWLCSGASTYYVQVVHTDAWCCLRIRSAASCYLRDATAPLSTLRSTYHIVVGSGAFSVAGSQAGNQLPVIF